MAGMFQQARAADPDVAAWDTAQVINMACMFCGATIANPDVATWNTAQVRNMREMFEENAVRQPRCFSLGHRAGNENEQPVRTDAPC